MVNLTEMSKLTGKVPNSDEISVICKILHVVLHKEFSVFLCKSTLSG